MKKIIKFSIFLIILSGIIFYFKDDIIGKVDAVKAQKQIEKIISGTINANQIQCDTFEIIGNNSKLIDKVNYDKEASLVFDSGWIIDLEGDGTNKYRYRNEYVDGTEKWIREVAGNMEGAQSSSGTYYTVSYGYLASPVRVKGIEEIEIEEIDGKNTTLYRIDFVPDHALFNEGWEKSYFSEVSEEEKTKYEKLYNKILELYEISPVDKYIWVNNENQIVQIKTDDSFRFYCNLLNYSLCGEESTVEEKKEALQIADNYTEIYVIEKYRYNEECDSLTLPENYSVIE